MMRSKKLILLYLVQTWVKSSNSRMADFFPLSGNNEETQLLLENVYFIGDAHLPILLEILKKHLKIIYHFMYENKCFDVFVNTL
jgi:hypothetical protein